MAAIGRVELDIQEIPNNLGAEVEVSYTITFDESDRSTNRAYREVIELIGADDGLLDAPDEPIRWVGRQPFFTGTIRADRRTTAAVVRTRRVERRELEGGRPGRHELRAQAILTAGARRVSRDSNPTVDPLRLEHAI